MKIEKINLANEYLADEYHKSGFYIVNNTNLFLVNKEKSMVFQICFVGDIPILEEESAISESLLLKTIAIMNGKVKDIEL